MIIKIDNKQVVLNGETKTTKRTLTKEEILRELVNGNLEFEDNTVYSSTKKGTVSFLTSKTFESEGKTYTLKKEHSEIELLDTLSNGGFVELNDNSFFQLGNITNSNSNSNLNSNWLTRIKYYQTKYVETAGTGTGTGGDTGIATSSSFIDLFSLFFVGDYKDFILKNRDNLEISFILGDRRSFILPRRIERTPYYSLNDLLNQTLIQEKILNIDYNFNATIDNNLNLKITDNHTGQPNLFGATFAISLRWKV